MPLATVTYSDIDDSFEPNPITGDLLKVTGPNSVVQSIINLVQINHYEKPFHPEIGGNIRKLLFEPLDNITSNLLANEIKLVIGNFEPRATVLGVYVQSNEDEDGYNILIEFSMVTVATPIQVSVFLGRTR